MLIAFGLLLFGVVASAQAAHNLDGITTSIVPNAFGSYIKSKGKTYNSDMSLKNIVLTTLISNGQGYASVVTSHDPKYNCTTWFETTDADGFAVFGIKGANRVYKNAGVCSFFRVRKLSDERLDVRWADKKGIGKVRSAAPLQAVNWSVFPLQKLTAGGISLGPITGEEAKAISRGSRATPVYYPGYNCKSCKNTLNEYSALSLHYNKQLRLRGNFVVGQSLLGGYEGDAVSSYDYEHGYLSGVVELKDFIHMVEEHYGKPSLIINREVKMKSDDNSKRETVKRPTVLVWGYGFDGQQLSSDEVSQQCNPISSKTAFGKYNSSIDQNFWECGVIFSISIDYKSIVANPPWVSKYYVHANSPLSLAHHHFTDRLSRVYEAKERYLKAKSAKP